MSVKPDKTLQIVTDPAEIQDIFDKEGAFQRAQEEIARLGRIDKVTGKFLEKAMSGKLFNIVWHKVESINDAESSFLKGRIMHSRDKDGEYFGLSVEVDYGKLYGIDPDKEEELNDPKSISLEFNQHRATVFSAGTYKTYAEAEQQMRLIDQYLMHVLAEAGAENNTLKIEGNRFVLETETENGNGQTYSDALRTARLVEAFRSNVIDSSQPSFRQVVGNLMVAIADELQLPYQRKEKQQLGKTQVIFDFGKDIGEFCFADNGEQQAADMTHRIKTGHSKESFKTRFEGELTSEALQGKLIDWLAAAARERETISDTEFDNMHGEIQSIKGVSLRDSKLGFLGPYANIGTYFTPGMN